MSESLGMTGAAFAPEDLVRIVQDVRNPARVVRDERTGHVGLASGSETPSVAGTFTPLGSLPPIYPEWLGDRGFCESHGVRFPYLTGPMANGIATPAMVVAIAQAGMLGFFGAGGLSYANVERHVDDRREAFRLQRTCLGHQPDSFAQ